MKKDSKKSHDAPLRLFVCPFHTALTAGWKDREENLHDGQPIWHGMAVRMGRDDEEYINLAKVWHQGKDLPKSYDDCIIDFGDSSYDVGHITEEPDGFYGWRTDWGLYTFEEIVQWAYLKDIVPIKLKKGVK
jgi:hypothetical protein